MGWLQWGQTGTDMIGLLPCYLLALLFAGLTIFDAWVLEKRTDLDYFPFALECGSHAAAFSNRQCFWSAAAMLPLFLVVRCEKKRSFFQKGRRLVSYGLSESKASAWLQHSKGLA
ncbi:MAG: hypothetical protein N3D11_05340 [Candidatus Sumerlaeia bacterium]|nr:hypothetical protein [Candidatus Sumerlaeia bacterium]